MLATRAPAPVAAAGEVAVACYDNELPPFLEAQLQHLYGNIHSTLAHLRIYGGLSEVSHVYVARRADRVTAALLFCHSGNTVRVINEGMLLDADAVSRFAAFVFARWPSVGAIRFRAVQSAIEAIGYPFQQYASTANIVLPLPATAGEYVASLGKNMRRNLRRYMDRLKRDFPEVRYEISERAAVNEAQLRAIIELNRVRVAGKNLRYGLEDEVDKVIALARECGMVGAMTIDGRVIAGAIGYFAGSNYFFKVIAHDPAYNDYSAGILCCYQTICACIARGCREYNFMWNEYEYKFALGAHSRSLHDVVVYRSRQRVLLSAPLALRTAAAGWRYRASALLEKAGKPESLAPAERFALRILDGLRNAKRLLARR